MKHGDARVLWTSSDARRMFPLRKCSNQNQNNAMERLHLQGGNLHPFGEGRHAAYSSFPRHIPMSSYWSSCLELSCHRKIPVGFNHLLGGDNGVSVNRQNPGTIFHVHCNRWELLRQTLWKHWRTNEDNPDTLDLPIKNMWKQLYQKSMVERDFDFHDCNRLKQGFVLFAHNPKHVVLCLLLLQPATRLSIHTTRVCFCAFLLLATLTVGNEKREAQNSIATSNRWQLYGGADGRTTQWRIVLPKCKTLSWSSILCQFLLHIVFLSVEWQLQGSQYILHKHAARFCAFCLGNCPGASGSPS